jgi:hypothetical protein
MGAASSKTTAKTAFTENEAGGIHLMEIHLPSASMGFGIVIIVAAVAILVCVLATRIKKWFNRQPPSWGNQTLPHDNPSSRVIYYAGGDQFPSLSVGHQRGRQQHRAMDMDRFVAIPPTSNSENASGTGTGTGGTGRSAPEAPPAHDSNEWLNLPRP